MDVKVEPRTPKYSLGRNDNETAVGHGRIAPPFGLR